MEQVQISIHKLGKNEMYFSLLPAPSVAWESIAPATMISLFKIQILKAIILQ